MSVGEDKKKKFSFPGGEILIATLNGEIRPWGRRLGRVVADGPLVNFTLIGRNVPSGDLKIKSMCSLVEAALPALDGLAAGLLA